MRLATDERLVLLALRDRGHTRGTVDAHPLDIDRVERRLVRAGLARETEAGVRITRAGLDALEQHYTELARGHYWLRAAV